MNLSQDVRRVAKRLPHRLAITSDAGAITYAQLEDNVGRIAGGLRGRLGLARGSRVGIAMENCGEYLQVLYGIWRAGMVAVPMNVRLHEKEIAFILANSGCEACFCTADVASRLGSLRHLQPGQPGILSTQTKDYAALLTSDPIVEAFSSAEDEAWLFYTSGTTGRPKGAVLSFRNLQFMSHCYYADVDHLDDRDVKLHAAPLSHGSGLYALPHIAKGSHHIIMSGFLRARPHLRCAGEAPACDDVRRAHHGVATDQPSTGRVRRYERTQDALLRRRSDVRKRPQEGPGDLRSQAHADLWPGRVAHDDQFRLETVARPERSSSPRGNSWHPAECLGAASTSWSSTAMAASCPRARSAK